MTECHTPAHVAERISAMPRPALLVFDCDGVLAPLVDHADDSVLNDDVGHRLATIAQWDDVTVAILSGRSLAGLEQFEFHESIQVAGSYGGERRGQGTPGLSDAEATLLSRLDDITIDAAAIAGDGAWVERKPTSVVVHVREADPERRSEALAHARQHGAALDGSEVHDGDNVVELMARPIDKGAGLDRLRDDLGAESVLYVGDDVPDEDAFARLTGDHDLGVKVGPGDTVATCRLADPDAVSEMLRLLT